MNLLPFLLCLMSPTCGGGAAEAGAASSSGGLLASTGVVAPSQGKPAGDVFPYFRADLQQPVLASDAASRATAAIHYGPALPHPVAGACAVDDKACVASHDLDLTLLATRTAETTLCQRTTEPAKCAEVVAFVNGETGQDRDPMLEDPCTFVVRVDRGVALLYSRTTRRTRWSRNRDWKPATFIGACDVSAISHSREEVVPALPGFPWAPR